MKKTTCFLQVGSLVLSFLCYYPLFSQNCILEDDYHLIYGESVEGNVYLNDGCDVAEYGTLISVPDSGILNFDPETGDFDYSNTVYGTYEFLYERCYILDVVPPEICQFGVTQMVVQYLGESGATVTVTNNNQNITFATFDNVQNGDILTITNNTGSNNGPSNNWEFYVNGEFNVQIHTSCSEDLLGNTYNDFLVLEYTSGNGVTNTIIECEQATVTIVLEPSGSISGYITKQQALINDDGDIVTASGVSSNVTVTLSDSEGNISIASSDSNGYYEFIGLPPGDYILSSTAPEEGCFDESDQDESTGPDDPDGGGDPIDNEIPVTLAPGEDDTDNNFVDEFDLASISGSVKEDINNDDIGDVPIEGVEISLFFATGTPALNGAGIPIPSILTDANGYYEFTELAAGNYVVIETQPIDYLDVIDGDDSNDGDPTDLTFNTDNLIFASLFVGEDDTQNNFVEMLEPCVDYMQADANERLSVGVVTNPGIIGTEEDIVNITFVVVNTSNEPLTNIELIPDVVDFATNTSTGDQINLFFSGDPNNNDILDPNEIWFYSAVNSFSYNQGDTFVVIGGATGDAPCGEEIGGAADLLFTSGVNMDVNIEEECAAPGDKIHITLSTRLLIDEDAAKNPGTTTIIVGGVPITIQLPATQWEARDLMISATGLNGGLEFDPFNPPAGIELTNFCEQAGLDFGRNTGNVLDECEPIETVRAPCVDFGEDDVLCEYPDWVFCYCITIPEDYDEETFTVTATDDFSIWKAEESPAGSGTYGTFEDITANVESGGADSESIIMKLPLLPVELISFDAEKNGRTSELTWATASEINNSHFMIERSVNGNDYEVIRRVNGNGTTSAVNIYMFVDDRPAASKNYYRLAQYDFDGAFERTDVRTVDFSYAAGSGRVTIYPNPVVDYGVLSSDQVIGDMTVEVYAADGAKVMSITVGTGEEIDFTQLVAGQYTVKVLDSSRYQIGLQKITIVK